eukprot:6363801-Alexandrium_andersonii.AAC.1
MGSNNWVLVLPAVCSTSPKGCRPAPPGAPWGGYRPPDPQKTISGARRRCFLGGSGGAVAPRESSG